MNEPELLDGIDRAMATTALSARKLEALLHELSGVCRHVASAAEEVNCKAMNVALEALRVERSGLTLLTVAEEAEYLEAHALKVLIDVSQRIQRLNMILEGQAGAAYARGGVRLL